MDAEKESLKSLVNSCQEKIRELKTTIVEKDKEIEKSQTRIDKATKCIKDFLCTEEYNKVDGKAIADNYMEVLNIFGSSDE